MKKAFEQGENLDAGLFNPDCAKTSWTLPASWYTDPQVFQKEQEAIFYKTWWYVCHQTDLQTSGDYFCAQVADQSVFVIRDDNKELHAFYNVCSHRAHPLLNGSGNTSLIVCPYHQWCYQTDGCFKAARGQESLKEWIPHNANLKSIRLEEYGGFLFVNLDQEAQSLHSQAAQFLLDIHECSPRVDDFVCVERHQRMVNANWKTVLDNNHECYHCAINHKTLMNLVDYPNKALWRDDGITFTHIIGRKQMDNGAYQLNDDEIEQDSLFGYIWPTLIPLFFPGTSSAVLFQIIPTGIDTCLIKHDFFFTSKNISQQERSFIDYILNTLVVEDLNLCENVQKGLNSKGYTQGKFVVNTDFPNYSEHHVHFYQKFVYDALTQT